MCSANVVYCSEYTCSWLNLLSFTMKFQRDYILFFARIQTNYFLYKYINSDISFKKWVSIALHLISFKRENAHFLQLKNIFHNFCWQAGYKRDNDYNYIHTFFNLMGWPNLTHFLAHVILNQERTIWFISIRNEKEWTNFLMNILILFSLFNM